MIVLSSIRIALAAASLATCQPPQVGNASVFAYAGDVWVGGPSPCLRRVVAPTDRVIAHRTLPCGTRVRVTSHRTGRAVVARVGERGPYGACLEAHYDGGVTCDRWAVKRREIDPGTWRGIADLTPAVARAIGHSGIAPVTLEVLP